MTFDSAKPSAKSELPELANRNFEIRAAVAGGMKRAAAAEKFGLSRERISQICGPAYHRDCRNKNKIRG